MQIHVQHPHRGIGAQTGRQRVQAMMQIGQLPPSVREPQRAAEQGGRPPRWPSGSARAQPTTADHVDPNPDRQISTAPDGAAAEGHRDGATERTRLLSRQGG
jgi:hypothetical protein